MPGAFPYTMRMRILPVIFLLLLSLPILGACSGLSGDGRQSVDLSDLPPIDPSDKILAAAVEDFLEETGAPVASGYTFSRVDLDSDGRRDALVLFKTPFGYWCDMHGCTMLVMKADNDDFSLINAIQPVRGPLYISEMRSNGWKNLVARVSGRWDEAKDVAMLYDGEGYPRDPSALPPYPKGPESAYTRVFIR